MSTNSLLIAPVVCDGDAGSPLRIDVPDSPSAVCELFLDGVALRVATPVDGSPTGRCIAVLAPRREAGETAWYVSPRIGELGINGMTPLPLVRIEPGALLSVGDRFWMVSALWQPITVQPPDELRGKSCSVCGSDLHLPAGEPEQGLVPVIQCVCGRWTHLERPDDPDDKTALNCYLVSESCGNCGRPTSLSPQILPEIPERLLQPPDEDDWFPAELLQQEAVT